MKKNKIQKSMDYIGPGIVLLGISLGSIFWMQLIRFSLFFLIITALAAAHYISTSLGYHFKNQRMGKGTVYFGFASLVLVSLFLGMQITSLPFKMIFLLIGAILFIIGLFKLFRKR